MKLVTIKQAVALRDIGYKEPVVRYAYDFEADNNFKLQKDMRYIKSWNKIKLVLPVPTVDEVIDWLRRKHNIMIYNHIEPYTDPADNRITYGYRVKKCNVKWGWNHRKYLSNGILSKDCYAAKRKAIWIAIRFIKKQKEDATKRRNCKNRRKRIQG